MHHLQPDPNAAVILRTPAELAARRREQRMLYARWAASQAVLRERDRKARRFWLGLGVTVAVVLPRPT